MEWVRKRCHEAPAKTVAVASISPRWASEVTRSASRALPIALGTLPRHRHASPHSPARALARGAYQHPQGIAHTGMGNARMQGQQSQERTVEGMATLGGARRSQSRRLAAEARHSGRLRGPLVTYTTPRR